jgi:hypothetical protein
MKRRFCFFGADLAKRAGDLSLGLSLGELLGQK